MDKIMKMFPWTGMEAKGSLFWGARTILERGGRLDLLHDRQGMSDYENPARGEFLRWILKVALPWLDKQGFRPDENRLVTFDDGRFHVQATPNASYGYVYVGAWMD